jgi:hypothetical protein
LHKPVIKESWDMEIVCKHIAAPDITNFCLAIKAVKNTESNSIGIKSLLII